MIINRVGYYQGELNFRFLFQVSSQMGSIAPLQKLQKKSVHALKRALSDSQLADLRMGNLCSMGATAAAKKVKIKPENIM